MIAMIDEDQVTYERVRPGTSRGHYLLEIIGILYFALLALLIAVELYGGVSASAICGSRRSCWFWPTLPPTSSPGSCIFSPTTSGRTIPSSSDPTSSNLFASTT